MAIDELAKQIRDLERRVRKLETLGDRVARARLSVDNVSDPPDNDEITTAFGSVITVTGPGFIGLIDDASGNTDVWLCIPNDTQWYYVQLTKATIPP